MQLPTLCDSSALCKLVLDRHPNQVPDGCAKVAAWQVSLLEQLPELQDIRINAAHSTALQRATGTNESGPAGKLLPAHSTRGRSSPVGVASERPDEDSRGRRFMPGSRAALQLALQRRSDTKTVLSLVSKYTRRGILPEDLLSRGSYTNT